MSGRRDEAARWADSVWGTREGFFFFAFCVGGHLNEHGTYAFSKPWQDRFGRWPDDRERFLTDAIEHAERGEDVYVAPYLRSKPSRKKGNALPSDLLYADLDQLTASLDGFEKLLIGPGGLLVNSGQNRHVYPRLPADLDPDKLERLNRHLAHSLGADHGWAENKYLRLPGTWNYKGSAQGGDPWPVLILDGDRAPRDWTPEELAELLGPEAPHSGSSDEPDIEPIAPLHVPAHLRERLREAPNSDRSDQMYAFVCACLEAGLTDGETLHLALRHRPTREKYGDRADAEIERVIRKRREEVPTIRLTEDGNAHGEEPAEFTVEPIETFASIEEPGADPLLGTPDAVLIPENGDVMTYGDGGVGKTTMQLDAACHLAAGDDWLGITVPRPLNVLIIEDEGPRALLRKKVRRKLAGWTGSPIKGRIHFVTAPWAAFTFADPAHREWLAAYVREHDIDVAMIGPLTAAGMEDAGTLQEVRRFLRLVQEVRDAAGRPLTVWLIHHEGKGGKVSGAWEGCGDALLHVNSEGHGRVRLHVQKARWSSAHHQTTLHLTWAENEGFEVEDKPEFDDTQIAEMILAAIGGKPGCTWKHVTEQTKGVGKDRRNSVRDRLFAQRRIVNVITVKGVETAMYECPERQRSGLHLADDQTIHRLRRESAADEPQTAAGTGAVGKLRLRRAARSIEPHDVAADAAPGETGPAEGQP